MKGKITTFSIVFILLVILSSIFYCDIPNPISQRPKKVESSVLKLSFVNIPSEVKKIVAKLSREGFETIIKEIPVTGQEVTCRFSQVAVGTWHLKVDAKNEADVTLYTGETDVIVIAGQTTNVHLELKPVGDIEIQITWGEGIYTFVYNFNNGDLSGWAGPADAEIYQNTLHLWSAYGYKWRTISDVGSPHFTKGSVEFDIRPLDGEYTFETKGASLSNGVLNWGVYMRWKDNFIYVHAYENGTQTLINTQVSYQPYNWYHIKIIFDGSEGTKGRFSFWVRDISTGGEEIFSGEYDYFARYGRLEGVNQISLAVCDPNVPRVEVKHVYFDNFYFEVSL